MVRYALNKNRIFVDAQLSLYDKDEIFTCIFCDRPLFYKKAHHKTRKETSFWVCGHFSHNVNIEEVQETEIDCISNQFVSTRSESAVHKYAKSRAENILNATTETYFKQDKFESIQEYQYPGRRTDIALVNKKGAGFLNYEIQTSPTSFSSITTRVEKDKSNYVGATIYAIGEISRRGSADEWGKGVGGLGATQAVLLASCLEAYGMAQDIQKVATHHEITYLEDTRTGFIYIEEKDIYGDIQFNQHKLIGRHNEISDVTTDTTAEVVYQAILEHEKLLKDPIIFDMGFTGKSSISHMSDTVEQFDGDDDNTKRYETPLAKLDLELLQKLKLLCQTHQGDIGAAIEFDIDTNRAKVVLLWQNVERYEWIDFKNLFISEADFISTTSSCKKTELEKEEGNSACIKIIKTERIPYNILNPIQNWSQETASRVQRLKIGDRCTWMDAPNWWNLKGEEINDIAQDGKVRLAYSGRYIPREEVILIESAE
ncbi:hypothetical protein [Nostoc sp. UIC 10630]|uniref:hypothetical protein n=1 Tax=Nostoc sp. UIC 10630 TaxID=2100146 RepID=UPI0013CF6F40|nr:hypothetical protein [Nostoc sp. UIC 10630]NEU81826.1 hypothetical protein [Nostoc sp. UIC 10630]